MSKQELATYCTMTPTWTVHRRGSANNNGRSNKSPDDKEDNIGPNRATTSSSATINRLHRTAPSAWEGEDAREKSLAWSEDGFSTAFSPVLGKGGGGPSVSPSPRPLASLPLPASPASSDARPLDLLLA